MLFQRKKAAPLKSSSSKTKESRPIIPEVLEEMNIEDFITGELEQPEKRMDLFDEKRMASALDDYVQKQQAQAKGISMKLKMARALRRPEKGRMIILHL